MWVIGGRYRVVGAPGSDRAVDGNLSERAPTTDRPALRGFISYARGDLRMVQKLRAHLKGMALEGLVEAFWYDPSIVAGSNWSDGIKERIANSDIFLLCLSSTYIASEFCYRVEIPAIRRRCEEAGGLIVPVVLRPCSWWGYLENLQAVPTQQYRLRPITTWKPVDTGYATAAAQIRDSVKVHLGLLAPVEVPPPQTPAPWPELSYDGPHRLSEEAIDRAVRSVLGRHAPAK